MSSSDLPGRVADGASRRAGLLLFAAVSLAYGWFHQGGGWNQNARFAMVRAVVEEGRLSIDDHLVYAADRDAATPHLVRARIQGGRFELFGQRFALRWRDAEGRSVGLDGGAAEGDGPEPGVTWVEPEQVAATADVSWALGHLHPAKAPGGALAAVPAYALLVAIERGAGLDLDDWAVLTANAWLTSALSVGLVAALGVLILYHLAIRIGGAGSRAALLAAVAFGLGTLHFPYATAFYEHDLIGVALLAALAVLHRGRPAPGPVPDSAPVRERRLEPLLAGLCAGLAAVANYAMAAVVVLLAGYLLFTWRRPKALAWYALGVLGPFLALCAYHQACFGTPFTTNYRWENPVFITGDGALLGVFGRPSPGALLALVASPFRGLLVASPALLLGVIGLVDWLRSPARRAEAWLIVAVTIFFFLLVSTFNGWHGGWASGPRYLVPAIPFLALPAVAACARWPRTAAGLIAVSVASTFLVTAVDVQSPVGLARTATVGGWTQARHSPVAHWAWPIFLDGRPTPLLAAQRAEAVAFQEEALVERGVPPVERAGAAAALGEAIDRAVAAGEPAPLLTHRGPDGAPSLSRSILPALDGPVSVNPTGFFEGEPYRLFPPHSVVALGNSLNAGELLFPGSRWSLVPLLAALAALLLAAYRSAGAADAAARPDPESAQPASRKSSGSVE